MKRSKSRDAWGSHFVGGPRQGDERKIASLVNIPHVFLQPIIGHNPDQQGRLVADKVAEAAIDKVMLPLAHLTEFFEKRAIVEWPCVCDATQREKARIAIRFFP